MSPRLFLTAIFTASSLHAAELFPFVPPWDDATPGATNISAWLTAPAGKDGFVTVKDGHLFAGGKRFRIFGVNMAFGANFPTHEAAEKVAGRLAKFGINCVRFHHMDMFSAPAGIFAKDGVTLDPERLDRLDYFIAQLKARGIYTNLNLHVSRTYPDRPKSEKQGNENYDKGVDNFAAAQIALQKDFARDLLTHVNPYTKTSYAQEPAVALIEINNENALLFSWQTGALDEAAKPYRDELSELWTKWLIEKYGDHAKIAAAWRTDAKPAGPELLLNGDFAKGLDGWRSEQHEGAAATASVDGGVLRVEVKTPGRESWHVQINQAGLKVDATDAVELKFRARASAPLKVSVAVGQSHEPWKVLASETFALTAGWQTFKLVRKLSASDNNARVSFSLGTAAGWIEIDDVTLHTAGLDGSVPALKTGIITAFTKGDYAGRTETAQRDWYRFLWTLEERYWPGMYAFIREELKAKPLILGTQLFWSPFPIQSRMDVIDSHAYWQHPHFPGKSWDMGNWTVKNDAMTGARDGGTLSRLALQRVAGKPYLVTEYNHSAPNTFAAETFPLVCAYAALQDWDGIFAFAYSHRGDDWDKGYFPSFFDIDQHPTKMATLPASLACFLRGDVAPATTEHIVQMSLADAIEQARKGGARIGADQFNVSKAAALMQRVGVKLGKGATPESEPTASPIFKCDTGELAWDTVDKVVTVNTARSKAIVGFAERRSYDLGGVKIDFGALNEGFGIVQLTVLDGADVASAKRLLITATATAENTDMQWTSDRKDSVGRNWGKAPSLVEGVPAKITLPGVAAKLKAWALDERGQRRAEVPVRDGVIEIGPQYRSVWYELAVE
jgi:hypothetical protein